MRPHERSRLLAESGAGSFEQDGIRVDIVDGPVVTEEGHLVVVLRAAADGTDLPLDNPFVFVNPPVRAPDGAGFVHDPARALQHICYDAAIGSARRLGWRR